MIIKDGMNIKIRTYQEREIFADVATKEGHKWRDGMRVRDGYISIPSSISVGHNESDKYPNDLSIDSVSYCGGGARNVIEASELFRNQLISKMLKEQEHEKRTAAR